MSNLNEMLHLANFGTVQTNDINNNIGKISDILYKGTKSLNDIHSSINSVNTSINISSEKINTSINMLKNELISKFIDKQLLLQEKNIPQDNTSKINTLSNNIGEVAQNSTGKLIFDQIIDWDSLSEEFKDKSTNYNTNTSKNISNYNWPYQNKSFLENMEEIGEGINEIFHMATDEINSYIDSGGLTGFIDDEINSFKDTFKDTLDSKIRGFILGKQSADIYDYMSMVNDIYKIVSSDKSIADKAYDLAVFGKDFLVGDLFSKGFDKIIKKALGSGTTAAEGTAIGASATGSAAIAGSAASILQLLVLALALGGIGYVGHKAIEKSDNVSLQENYNKFNKRFFSYYDFGAKQFRVIPFFEDIVDKLTIDTDKIHNGSEADKLTDGNVTGLKKYIDDKLNTSIWEFKLPITEKPESYYLPEENVAGFDESLLINGSPHIWIIERSPLPGESLLYNGINNKEDVFDEEDIEKIKDMMQEGSVVNHYTIAPKLSLSGTNINQSIDFKMIMAQLEKAIKEELTTAPEGVYRK